jgi:tripartite-type tricarboxylate transporter receptor subunit TctC
MIKMNKSGTDHLGQAKGKREKAEGNQSPVTLHKNSRGHMETASIGGRVAAAVVLSIILAGNASAQSYPAKPVRIVVPYPPGGGNDLLARIIGQKLIEKWGQKILVDNRGGASGMIGADIVAKSAGDGYTLCVCASPEVALNVTLHPKMAYDPVRDFAPITQLAVSPIVLTVHPSLPTRSVQEFIALAKKRPAEISYASVGAGTPHHIAGEWMKLMAGINITHVSYKGGGPQLVDLMGGHVQSAFVALPVVAPYLKSGRVRLLAVTTARRSQVIQDVPTLGESGLAGFDVSQWYGMVVPAGTPGEITARLHGDVVEILKLPDVRARMIDLGAEPVGSTPAEFGEHIRSEIAKYRKIVAATGITIN